MNFRTQPPTTFFTRTKKPTAQPSNQYRPSSDPNVPRVVHDAFRQAFDLVQNIRDTQTPTSLFARGNQTGEDIAVPVFDDATTQGQLGTSLGLNLQLTRPGNWILTASVCLKVDGDSGQLFTLSLVVTQSPQGNPGQRNPTGDETIQLHQSWQVQSVSGQELCRLYIVKDGGAGNSVVLPANTTFTATWQGA